ncbi:MAG: PAS domain S-box protein [Comamonadaceae bacterium]
MPLSRQAAGRQSRLAVAMSLQFLQLVSLKTRLTLFTLGIFLGSIWALAFYAGRTLQGDIERLLGEQQLSVVSATANHVSGELTTRLQALETIAEEMDADLIDHPAALQARLKQRPLLQLLFNGGAWSSGQDGIVIASNLPALIGTNYADREYMMSVLKQGKSTISNPITGKVLKDPIFVMAVPIRDGQGRVIGALAGVTDLGKANFLDKITSKPYGKTGGYLLVAPRQRQIITATDKKRVMEMLPAAGINRFVDRNIAGYEGYSVLVNALGEEQLASVKQMPAVGWYMVLGTPTAEAFEPIHAMLQRIRLTTLFLTLLAGGLTWLMLRRQLSPLVATADAMVSLAGSNRIPMPFTVTSQDEIGRLTGGFNRLIETWTQREDALRRSEQSLSITLHSIGDAVIATDTFGRVTRMNPAAERLCGWKLAEAMGHPLAEVFCIVDATTREAMPDPVQQVMAQGQVVGLVNHTVLLTKDGQEYKIADSAAPIRNAVGEIVGVVLVFSDVTERYRAEEALRAGERRFRSYFDQPMVGIAITSPEMGWIEANEHLCKMLGYSNDELTQLTWAAFTHPDDLGADVIQFERVLRGEIEGYALDKRFLRKDSSVIHVFLSVRCVRKADGAVDYFVALLQDITERKQAEAKLLLAASVFDHAREGITITDAHGTIVDINEAFTRITGYSREEAIGQNPRILKSSRQDKAFYEAMWEELTGPGHWSGEVWNRRKNGEVYPELVTISAVRDGQGTTQHYVALFSDITAIKTHQSQLEHIAHFDALTNLPNRVLLADRLQQAMVQAQRREQQLAVVYLDLDGFKAINDRHSHEAGDQLLITLALRMKQALREGDTLARLGGDEFVALLIDLEDMAASVPMLARLLSVAAQPIQWGDHSLQVSASLGVTFYPQAHDMEADQLLRQADQAMYQAKVAGKNRYQIFDAALDRDLRGHHEGLERIRLALETHEFVLHYQPKVNMRTGQVVGAEALIRWQHPEKGLLAPAIFLPVIEIHPMAVAIGEWVIDTALTQSELWQAAGLDLPVSVNIGARQLQQGNFVERLQSILAAHPGVRPGGLELEVLETSALEDIALVSQVIEDCAQIGVKFALDDFGTGYSSLTYLRRLGVSMLKIDQSFVRDVIGDPDDIAILQGVIGLAAAFKHEVIAEGVETVAHGTLLLQLGCELAQGYGIAGPMPPEQMPAWAATWQPYAAWCAVPGSEETFRSTDK